MFKDRIKRVGMTIPELILIFAIIGLIGTIAIVTARPFDKATKYLYSRAYDALTVAVYNAYVDIDNDSIDSPEILCQGLAKYINSNAATNPSAGESYSGNPDEGFCNNVTTRATKNTESFKSLTPDFVANNNMKFYITKKFTESNVTDSDGLSGDISYYIVYVDLDGDRGKGLVAPPSANTPADVVAFAATDAADIIPLGPPVTDKSYITARVIYPEDETHTIEKYSAPVSYFEALRMAWGGETTLEDYRTYDFNQFLPSGSPIIKNITYPTAPSMADECEEFDCDIRIQRYY